MTYDNADVILAIEKDPEAFSRLYRSVYKDLYRLAWYSLSEKESAEDAVSEAVTDAWKGIQSLKQPEAFGFWITKILIRKCNAILRERYNRAQEMPGDISDLETVCAADVRSERDLLRSEARTDLERGIMALSDTDREIISLCVVAGYKSEEAGLILSMNSSTVRSRLNRALAKLRNTLYDAT